MEITKDELIEAWEDVLKRARIHAHKGTKSGICLCIEEVCEWEHTKLYRKMHKSIMKYDRSVETTYYWHNGVKISKELGKESGEYLWPLGDWEPRIAFIEEQIKLLKDGRD